MDGKLLCRTHKHDLTSEIWISYKEGHRSNGHMTAMTYEQRLRPSVVTSSEITARRPIVTTILQYLSIHGSRSRSGFTLVAL